MLEEYKIPSSNYIMVVFSVGFCTNRARLPVCAVQNGTIRYSPCVTLCPDDTPVFFLTNPCRWKKNSGTIYVAKNKSEAFIWSGV